METKNVVVLGAGYAGATLAAKLDKIPGVKVTVVSPRDFIVHKISGLRAATKGGNWVDRTFIPLTNLVKRGEFVKASATSVKSAAKTIVLDNGKELKYDVLVVATGSRNLSPGDPPRSVTTLEGSKKYLVTMREAISKTKNVVIVGAGAVGLELAGEIHEYVPGAKVTIVTRSKNIMNDGMTYREKGIKAVLDDFAKLNIEIIYNDEVTSHPVPENGSDTMPIVQTPEGVTLKSGRKIASDLLVLSVGSILNTDFLPSEWLDKTTGEVIVDQKTMLVQGTSDVFAVGDIAKSGSAKRGYFAAEDGKVVAKNVLQVLKGGKPTGKIQRMNLIFLTTGSKGGRGLLPFGTLGPMMTTMVKSKDLFVKQFWGTFAPGVPVPKAD